MHPDDIATLGTPKDYSANLYKFYLEVVDFDGTVLKIVKTYFGEARASFITPIDHGYELIMPIQAAPDLVRELSLENLAIYQLTRYAKVSGSW
ncbi:hypothetical protein WH96_02525 [Kiloniella spongiae]|uniref:Uncharacterized protein n=1 Tax=Kiloniella spongiae TaxID=1489064 RepID=A0A0H2MJ39_9PROT|nr:hypothetical protein [Kiloniella spongiae]KLN62398.1 hypothetical protein WH96_02525 [Kiloniella spongiae]